jgi:hypothetical protein
MDSKSRFTSGLREVVKGIVGCDDARSADGSLGRFLRRIASSVLTIGTADFTSAEQVTWGGRRQCSRNHV